MIKKRYPPRYLKFHLAMQVLLSRHRLRTRPGEEMNIIDQWLDAAAEGKYTLLWSAIVVATAATAIGAVGIAWTCGLL